jgi:hypothetical protein
MKHPSLPQSLTVELLASWIVQNAKEKFTEERKYYYTEDELNEFKDKAVQSGIELNNLAEKKARLNKILDNGTDPNQETHNMYFFDIEGNEVPERLRPLSAKEIREYVAQFKVDFQQSKQA